MGADEVKTLALIVKSPAGILFERPGLQSVQLDLSDGKIGIRVGHAPVLAEISDGEAALNDGKSIESLSLHGGIVSIQDDVITIYTHSLDFADASFENNENHFDEVYESIISTLIPGYAVPEGQHGT